MFYAVYAMLYLFQRVAFVFERPLRYYHTAVYREDELARMEEEQRIQRERQMAQAKRVERQDGEAAAPQPVQREGKVGRNALCPCGSGKKYKKCCGRFS